jgi:phosphate transport system protein
MKPARQWIERCATFPFTSEDTRTISTGLDQPFIAKAIERIGDHATNIAETVVYVG